MYDNLTFLQCVLFTCLFSLWGRATGDRLLEHSSFEKITKAVQVGIVNCPEKPPSDLRLGAPGASFGRGRPMSIAAAAPLPSAVPAVPSQQLAPSPATPPQLAQAPSQQPSPLAVPSQAQQHGVPAH